MMQVGSEISSQLHTDTAGSPWPEMALPTHITGTRSPGFGVLIRRSAIDIIEAHGHSNRRTEVCGVLVGNVYRDSAGPLLYIRSIIRGDPATGGVAQVTFTSQTWTHIHDELERNHADERIVGWYHTHPGHGIFLSGMDLFIHENFFNLPWQVALVFDPQNEEHGVFVWKDHQTERTLFIIEDDVVAEPVVIATDPTTPSMQSRHALRRWTQALWSWLTKKKGVTPDCCSVPAAPSTPEDKSP